MSKNLSWEDIEVKIDGSTCNTYAASEITYLCNETVLMKRRTIAAHYYKLHREIEALRECTENRLQAIFEFQASLNYRRKAIKRKREQIKELEK